MPISPVMAIRLDKAFGGGGGTWYRHQAAYDLARAMVQAEHIEVVPLGRQPRTKPLSGPEPHRSRSGHSDSVIVTESIVVSVGRPSNPCISAHL